MKLGQEDPPLVEPDIFKSYVYAMLSYVSAMHS